MPAVALDEFTAAASALRAVLVNTLPMAMLTSTISPPVVVARVKTQMRVQAGSAQTAKEIIQGWAYALGMAHVRLELMEIAP